MSTDADLLKTITERFDYAETESYDIREEAKIDMRYVAGDPWDPDERRARDDAKRPCMSFDELSQYTNQVINDARANPRAMKFTPTGSGASDKGAEFYADKAREIEYRSHAQAAYTTAYQNCVERSYGWVRIYTEYEHDETDNQDVWIGEIPNPDMVRADPEALKPDSSDMGWLLYFEGWRVNEFKRKYPDAKIRDFSPDTMRGTGAESWLNGDMLRIAEYWTKDVKRTRKLLTLKPLEPNGEPLRIFEDEFDGEIPSDLVMKSRPVEQFEVKQYLTNGVEILEEKQWAGKYIPFVSCYGKIIYVDEGSGAKKQLLSMTRLGRSPIMAYAYCRTTEFEIIGGIPKFPYFAYKGQLDPTQLNNLEKSLREPVAVIFVDPVVDGSNQQVLPLPERQTWDPALQGIEAAAEACRRAIQSAMGIAPLPTQAMRQNENTGVALKQVEKTAQIGAFHFSDHYDYMIRQTAVIVEDLLDKIIDSSRDTSIRKPDEDSAIVRVNDNDPSKFAKGQTEPVHTKGDYLVTVSSGPAADSQRDAVSDFVGTLSAIPEIMQLCGDLIVRLQSRTMNLGPLMDELADRLTPPQFKKQDGTDPKQLQQQLQVSQQTIQQLQQAVATLSQEIKTQQAKQQASVFKTKADNALQMQLKATDAKLQLQLQAMKGAAQIAVAKIAAASTGDEGLDEEVALAMDHAHEDAQAALDRQHEVGMAHLAHAHSLDEADQAHQQQLEEGAQGHQQALEQGAQGVAGQIAVADAAPQPEPGGAA